MLEDSFEEKEMEDNTKQQAVEIDEESIVPVAEEINDACFVPNDNFEGDKDIYDNVEHQQEICKKDENPTNLRESNDRG